MYVQIHEITYTHEHVCTYYVHVHKYISAAGGCGRQGVMRAVGAHAGLEGELPVLQALRAGAGRERAVDGGGGLLGRRRWRRRASAVIERRLEGIGECWARALPGMSRVRLRL